MLIDFRREMALAVNALQAGKLDDATNKLRELLKIHPRSADALHLLGVVLGLQNNHSEAEQRLRKAAEIDGNNKFIVFNLAKAISEQGKHADSIKWHEKAISLDRNDPIAWLNYGKSLYDLGDFDNAMKALDQAILLDANLVEAYTNKAICQIKKKTFEDALDLLNQAISLQPNFVLAWSNRGLVLNNLKRHEEALVSYERCIELKPDFSEAWSGRGVVLYELKRYEEALFSYGRCIELNQYDVEAWSNLGVVLNVLKFFERALASFDRCIELKPDLSDAWNRRGFALNELNRAEEALLSFGRAIELKSDSVSAWNNRGSVLNELKRHKEALVCYDKCIELDSSYTEAWNGRGVALAEIKQHEEALSSYDRCIELKPDVAEVWNNRGVALGELKRYEEALYSYDKSIALNPDFPDAYYFKGLLQLSHRNFLQGFENCLWRWKTKKFLNHYIDTSLPLCNPMTFSGHVLLWAEQGLGDEIFYASMLSQANNTCSKITLLADRRLHTIFKRSFPNIDLIDKALINDLANISYGKANTHAPIGDLGHLIGLDFETIAKTRKPFILTDSNKTIELKKVLPKDIGKIVCGISWRSINKDLGVAKSLTLRNLAPLINNSNFSFVNLQYGDVNSEIKSLKEFTSNEIYSLNGVDLFHDIDGLLALIDSCDLVVTTSNVTAHLAGSIGKRGCILVPYSKGRIWYWHLNDIYSLWYPSLKLFYQENPNDWTSAINQMVDWIEANYL